MVQVEVKDLTEKVKQLEERLQSSQLCSTSSAVATETADQQEQSSTAGSLSSGQIEAFVQKLADSEMQKKDQADKEARDKKMCNAMLRNFAQALDETPENLKVKVDAMLAERIQTTVVCASAKRIRRKDAALGHVLVEFKNKADKLKVFKARGKLAGTPVGMDDDLTQLQQQRKNAAWPAFKEATAKGLRTQWPAEKLFVKEGERFVEHKVLNL